MSRALPRFRRTNPPTTAAIPPIGLLRCQVNGMVEGQVVQNRFDYEALNPPQTAAELALFGTAWTTAVRAAYLGCCSADYQFTGLKLYWLTSPLVAPVYQNPPSGPFGTGPAGHEPNQVAQLFTKYTATRGQRGRGRWYLPAVPTSWVTASFITVAGGLTAQNTFAAAALSSIITTAANYTPCVAATNKNFPGGGYWYAYITSVLPRTLLATVRRRRIGRGK